MDKQHRPTKKGRNLLMRQQRERALSPYHRQQKLIKRLWIVTIVLIVGGGIFGGVLFLTTRPSSPASAIISQQGIHWHAGLTIKILDQSQEIPADIGINTIHRPLHTHQPDGIIHMEFSGLVREDDIRIGRFFEIWERTFSEACILDKCNGTEGEVTMLVNGQPNFEFRNYIMRDEDSIEILFEK